MAESKLVAASIRWPVEELPLLVEEVVEEEEW